MARPGIAVFLVVGTCVLAIIAVVSVRSLSMERRQGPRVSIDAPHRDLGVLDPEDVEGKQIAFTIHNRGTSDLVISGMKVGCPCFHPKLGASVLAPGLRTLLTMDLAPPNRDGVWEETVVLQTNDAVTPVTELSFGGLLKRRACVVPGRVDVDLKPGATGVVELTVRAPGDAAGFRVLGVDSNRSCCRAESMAEVRDDPDSGLQQWKVKVSVSARGVASWDDVIHVYTNDRERRVLSVPISVRERSAVSLRPPLVLVRARDRERHARHVCEVEGKARDDGVELFCTPWLGASGWWNDTGGLTVEVHVRSALCGPRDSGWVRVAFRDGTAVDIPVLLVE